ncbi:MAG: DnaD domain protein [Lachnospira pectinoschiza]
MCRTQQKSINYIEKVALSWASKNIHTIAEAKRRLLTTQIMYTRL